jgi:hypothetical protein
MAGKRFGSQNLIQVSSNIERWWHHKLILNPDFPTQKMLKAIALKIFVRFMKNSCCQYLGEVF